MASTESTAQKAHFQSITDRMAANPDMDLVALRSMFEELAALAAEPEDVTYAEVRTRSIAGIWCKPLGAATDAAILYTHGGGFMGNTASSHRKLAGHLAKATGVPAFVLDYTLAPERQFPFQVEETVAAYRWLNEQGFSNDRIVAAGDSAGGNLAVTGPLKLRDLGEPLPAAICAFSPWVDMEHLGKTLESNADTDALVSTGVVTMMGQTYLGEAGSPTDPLANPLHADLTGFPPLFITAGEYETLLDNGERLAQRARDAGIPAEFTTYPEQQHVFTFMAGRAPEADKAISAAGAWLRSRLGLA